MRGSQRAYAPRAGAGTAAEGIWRILLIVLILLVYASLHPWQFHSVRFTSNPLWVLLNSWPGHVDRFLARDIAVNVLGYVPLGLFGFVALAQGQPRGRAAVLTVLIAAVLSSCLETAQLFEPVRTSSALDVLCNTAGAAAGVALARLHSAFFSRNAAGPGFRAIVHPSGPMLLLLCWVGYLVFPPLPLLSRTRLAWKLAAFWSAPFSPMEALAGVADWLMAAWVLERCVGTGVRRALLALMMLLPARLLIVDRSLTLSECVGAAAAYVIWRIGLEGDSRRTVWLAWASVAALILRGLAPFHFSNAPGEFTWVPFGATLGSEPDAGLVVLFRKCFLYGTTVWLFRGSGYGYARSALGLAWLLAALEAAQRYLPGRSAEITDPLLVLIVALVLVLADSPRIDSR